VSSLSHGPVENQQQGDAERAENAEGRRKQQQRLGGSLRIQGWTPSLPPVAWKRSNGIDREDAKTLRNKARRYHFLESRIRENHL
jgi:hypothetical protein